jgi:hypothetical protein
VFNDSRGTNAFSKTVFLYFGRFYSFMNISVVTSGVLDMILKLIALRNFEEKCRVCVLFLKPHSVRLRIHNSAGRVPLISYICNHLRNTC